MACRKSDEAIVVITYTERCKERRASVIKENILLNNPPKVERI